jgi:oligopeptide transport system substrate-binding protein
MTTNRTVPKWVWVLIPIVAVCFCLGAAGIAGAVGWFALQKRTVSTSAPPNITLETPVAVPVGGSTPRATATSRPSSGATASPNSGELRLMAGGPTTLDPALSGDADSAEYIEKIFSGLVALNDQLIVVPDIADSWDVSEDGATYTFHLRSDVLFQDGKRATARDFKYSIERACDPRLKSGVAAAYLGDIAGALDKLSGKAADVRGVVVVDDRTVRISLVAPVSYFLAKLTYSTACFVDQSTVEQGGAQWTDHPNGTGPFVLSERSDQQVVLVRSDRYYGEPIHVDKVTFLHSGGDPVTMYEQGELDAAPVGASQLDRLQDPANPLSHELTQSPLLSVEYVGFNVQLPPFDDLHVRRAFAMATNKAGITEVYLNGAATPADGILPPGMPGYQRLGGIAYDPSEAKKELSLSRYGSADKLPRIVLEAIGQGATNSFAELLTLMYKETLGVTIEIEQVDDATYYDELDRGVYQMFILGWVADYPDPQNFLDLQFHSGSALNQTGYNNPAVDSLLEQARTERSESRRVQLYQEVERVVVSEAPWIPLSHGVDYTLVKPYVTGLSVTAQGNYYLKRVQFVAN